MDYYCDVCDTFIEPKSKNKHFKSNTHKGVNKCKHAELTIENPDKKSVNEAFYAYIIQHNRECDYYFIKCHFELVFNDNQYSTYIKSNLFDNKTKISWRNFSEKVIDDFQNKRYIFNHIIEMNIITIDNKLICHTISISNITCTLLNGN